MSVSVPTAADIPDYYDVVINGKGYIFLRTIDTSLPFRTQRAKYTRTATFLERTNVTGSYSDNQQDFFLTVSQNDWSSGEGQRFAHVSAPDTMSNSWRLDGVKVSKVGEVSLLDAFGTIAAGAQSTATSYSFDTTGYATNATNLIEISYGGSANSTAHGLGVTPNTIVSDGNVPYISSTGGGSVGVRRGRLGTGFTTFSATASDVLCCHNNALYGVVNSTGLLQVYSTAGVASTLYQWKRPNGAAQVMLFTGMASWGGKLLMVSANQLWIYDGSSVSLLAEFPVNFLANLGAGSPPLCVIEGIVLISGFEYHQSAPGRPAVYVYVGGNITKLWSAPTIVSNPACRIATFDGGAVWNDDSTKRIMYWDPGTGAISSLFTYTGSAPGIAANYTGLFATTAMSPSSDTAYYPLSTKATSGSVYTSLYDFDNSLTKQFRGVKVDFIAASDGDGGSVDVSYQVDSLDGAYTSLQTGAVSGNEYMLTSVSGRAIALKVTINKGTSTLGPILKRIYVRAAPQLQSYRSCEYMLDVSGVQGKTPVILNDDETAHPLSGVAQALNIQTAIAATTPFTVIDRFGTYTGVIEPSLTELIEIAPEEYIARVMVREV